MTGKNKLTYISLFSSAGIGCYGFKLEGFDCIATNELIGRRLDIQKYNKKCKYKTGYILGDITSSDIKDRLYGEINFWKKSENISRVDVVVATPPCQGMSVANHKKTSNEIIRNSLVMESIEIIKNVNPKFFIFENVPAFMKTICTDFDGVHKTIAEAIRNNLGDKYSYVSRIINFKNYGACSSRQRTVVIGVSKDYADEVSPIELYPEITQEKTLKEVIGDLKSLSDFGEIDDNDIYHSFRAYPEHMREWIAGINEGESAFDNTDDLKKPHQIINGKIVINKQKNGDKYRRQIWNKVGPCIHTRNDQLASQNTIHPSDDRVFSIRELMRMMTVPDVFKWVDDSIENLNNLSANKKREFLKKEEIKIRQSLGEAVPTVIFRSIAAKIKEVLKYPVYNTNRIKNVVKENELFDVEKLFSFIETNPLDMSIHTLRRISELANIKRIENAAYFTNKSLVTEIIDKLPLVDKEVIRILEPSVGVGNFIPVILKKFEGKKIIIDLVDVDVVSLKICQMLIAKQSLPSNVTINFIHDDFLLHEFDVNYDYVIGNPPFLKMKANNKLLELYRQYAINKKTNNICSFFLDKAMGIGNYVAMVFPKFLLNTPEFCDSRSFLESKAVECIIDFGEKGFRGVLVETIAVLVNNTARILNTRIISVTENIDLLQRQKYIFDNIFPYWIIYRNNFFDMVCNKLNFNVFKVFRDRQITNGILSKCGEIRVLKSRNISDDGKEILDLEDYDSYVSHDIAKDLSVYHYLMKENIYLTPNMTYKPRVVRKPSNVLVNGSLAILEPLNNSILNDLQLEYFSSEEYRKFYKIARNFQTRSLNVDSFSVFFYGMLKSEFAVTK